MDTVEAMLVEELKAAHEAAMSAYKVEASAEHESARKRAGDALECTGATSQRSPKRYDCIAMVVELKW